MKKLFSQLKNKRVLFVLVTISTTLIILGVYFYWQIARGRVFIDNALINAPIVAVSSTAGGRLIELDAQEGKLIKKGDTIAVVGSETIRATTDGLIIMANNQVGGTVLPQTPLVQLIDPSELRVEGTIDENKGLNQLKVGQIASFTVDAFPGKKYWGYVDEISPTAKQTQLAFSISSERPTQQFQVYVRFNAAQYPEIKNGMSAKLTIFTDTN